MNVLSFSFSSDTTEGEDRMPREPRRKALGTSDLPRNAARKYFATGTVEVSFINNDMRDV